MLKLYVFDSGTEKDWFAAESETEARHLYQIEYDLNDSDMEFLEVGEVEDPEAVTVYLEEIDAETEEQAQTTAAAVMAGMSKGGMVCSTAW